MLATEVTEQAPEEPAPEYRDTPDMFLPTLQEASVSFWSRVWVRAQGGLPVVAAFVGTVLFLMAAILYLPKLSFSLPNLSFERAPAVPSMVVTGAALPLAPAGWIDDYSPGSSGWLGRRRISVMRASSNLTDFRLEFQGVIDYKALGWVFRAQDPDNFYVTKVEIVKPGPHPKVTLTRFAVIRGKEQERTRVPLTTELRAGAPFKVRLDVVGSRFTTWIQDEKVDEWTDDHIFVGRVGVFSERGERGAIMDDMTVYPLVRK